MGPRHFPPSVFATGFDLISIVIPTPTTPSVSPQTFFPVYSFLKPIYKTLFGLRNVIS